MAQEFNRQQFPSGGGWVFRQPATNWVNPMAMVGFKASVDSIRKHRLANPAITAKFQLKTDPSQIGDELEQYTRLRLGIPLQQPNPFQGRSSLPARVVEAAAAIKRAAQGLAVPLDWFQSGGEPVEQALAEKRALACVNCPKNVVGAWYTTSGAFIIEETIKTWQKLTGKNDFKFETKQGEALKSCGVCHCIMRIKVFVPLKHIVEKTKPDVMAEFPPNCWIAKRDQ
jgi:hypothetical protein